MIRLCVSGTDWCSGLNPCEPCLAAVKARVLPAAMIAGGFNSDADVAQSFLEAYMQAFRSLQAEATAALQKMLAAQAAQVMAAQAVLAAQAAQVMAAQAAAQAAPVAKEMPREVPDATHRSVSDERREVGGLDGEGKPRNTGTPLAEVGAVRGPTAPARLDTDGTAKPLSEIVAVMPPPGMPGAPREQDRTVHVGQATHYFARPTSEDAPCNVTDSAGVRCEVRGPHTRHAAPMALARFEEYKRSLHEAALAGSQSEEHERITGIATTTSDTTQPLPQEITETLPLPGPPAVPVAPIPPPVVEGLSNLTEEESEADPDEGGSEAPSSDTVIAVKRRRGLPRTVRGEKRKRPEKVASNK